MEERHQKYDRFSDGGSNSILDSQYLTLDSAEREKFRTALKQLLAKYPGTNHPMIAQLEKQSEDSLKKLVSSIKNILHLHKDKTNKYIIEPYENILSNANVVLYRKQQDIPVAYNAILGDLDDDATGCIKIDQNYGQPYFTLSFVKPLSSTMMEIFAPYEYSNNWAYNPEMIHISKTSIKGSEDQVNNLLRQGIINKKTEIITSLKNIVEKQRQRCVSTEERLTDRNLQTLFNQAQVKLNELTIAEDTDPSVIGILTVINSITTFSNEVDNAVNQFKQSALKQEADPDYKKKLETIVGRSSKDQHRIRPEHGYSQYEINNFLTITPRKDNPSIVILAVNSQSTILNHIINKVYGACESKDRKTFNMARRGNMMFLDKTLLENSNDLSQQVKDEIWLNKDDLVAELKDMTRSSIDRCCSNEQRLASPELVELKKQGEAKLSNFDKLSNAEELVQAISEAQNYKETVSSAIDTFKQAHTSTKLKG